MALIIRIERLDDPRLNDYRNVPDAELLRHRGLFVAEGRLVVDRLLDSGHPVASLLLNEASFSSLRDRLAALPDIPVFVCSTDELASIVGFNLHRGCLALAERPPDRPLADIIKSAAVLVLENVTDADNVGSAFRNAAAFRAGGVLLSPACCDPLYRKAVRTSMGSVLRVPYVRARQWPDELRALKAEGFTVVALTPREHAVDLSMVGPTKKMALLVGGEREGLSAAAEALADVCARIPIDPGVDSLNLATATGIALYCLTV